MGNTKIDWTDKSWNPVTGCTKISAGCQNCYAEKMAMRLKSMGQPNYKNGFDVTLQPQMLNEPSKWKKPCRVFVNSMSDTFHKDVPFEYLDMLFAVITQSPQHTFQVLTKRPERMMEYINTKDRVYFIQKAIDIMEAKNNTLIDEELWLPINGYVGLYDVSNYGRVRRIDNNKKGRRNPEGILTPRDCKGYETIMLSKESKTEQFRINRLVLETFGEKPPSDNCDARHIDDNRKNNRIDNLLWGTRTDNMADAKRHGSAGSWMKSKAKFSASEIEEIRKIRLTGVKLSEIAMRFDTDIKHISAICVGTKYAKPDIAWPLPNLWLGVTAENQEQADARIPILLQIPAAVRFVSIEPCLSEVDLNCLELHDHCLNPLTGEAWDDENGDLTADLNYGKLNWVIAGCESGTNRRKAYPQWFRDLAADCETNSVPFFLKQMEVDGKLVKMPELDGRVWDEFPEVSKCADQT